MRKINPIVIGIFGVNVALFLFFTQHFLVTISDLLRSLDFYITLATGDESSVQVMWFFVANNNQLRILAEAILFISAILFIISLFFFYQAFTEYKTLEKNRIQKHDDK